MSKISVIVLLMLATLSSCNIYNKFKLPTETSALAKEYSDARAGVTDTVSFGTTPWREVFTDPALVALIERALENNVNLRNAQLNIEAAQAQLQGAKLSFLPSIALTPNGGGAKYGKEAMGWTYSIPLSVNWEVDIFGRLLNGKRRAKAAVLQSQEYRQAVQSQLIGSVANCYYLISSLKRELALYRATAITWQESVEIMKAFKEAGRVTESAVVQSRAQYFGALAAIPDVETQIHEAQNNLSLLLNTMPQVWDVPEDAELSVPANLQGDIAVSKLANRPDVRAAEQQLAMAFYTENQARSNFYPQLNISLDGGFTNNLGGLIKNPGEFFLNLVGSLVAPIFSRGTNIANLKVAKAQQKQALNNCETTILNASVEVSNAMTLYNKSCEKSVFLAEQTSNLAKAVEYSSDLMRYSGTTTYIEVLTAQQNLLASQISEIACSLDKSRAVVNMYQALGGGK